MSAYLVFFLLFYLQVIVIPIGISPFEAPKVVIAEITILLLFLLQLQNLKKDLKSLFTSHQLFIVVLFLLSLDQLLIFHPTAESFFGNPFRMQGLLLFWSLLLFSILSKHISLAKIPRAFYFLTFTFLVLGTLIAGINQNNRAFSTLGEPNALAATVVFMFPFLWSRIRDRFKPLISLAALAIIILAGSRAGLIAFILELVFYLCLKLKLSFSKSTIISLLIIIGSVFIPFTQPPAWYEDRSTIWQTAYQAGLNQPLLGHGFGNIQSVIHSEAAVLNNGLATQVVDSSHNFLLDYWIQGGIVALVSILTLIALRLKDFIVEKNATEIVAFLGIITVMLFNPMSVVNLLAFWWLIG